MTELPAITQVSSTPSPSSFRGRSHSTGVPCGNMPGVALDFVVWSMITLPSTERCYDGDLFRQSLGGTSYCASLGIARNVWDSARPTARLRFSRPPPLGG